MRLVSRPLPWLGVCLLGLGLGSGWPVHAQSPNQGAGGAYAVRPAPWLRGVISTPPVQPTPQSAPQTASQPSASPPIEAASPNQARIVFEAPAQRAETPPIRKLEAPAPNAAPLRPSPAAAGTASGGPVRLTAPTPAASFQASAAAPRVGQAGPRVGMTIPDPPPGTIPAPTGTIVDRRPAVPVALTPRAVPQAGRPARTSSAGASVPPRPANGPIPAGQTATIALPLAKARSASAENRAPSPPVNPVSLATSRANEVAARPSNADLRQAGPVQAAPQRQDVGPANRAAARATPRRTQDVSNPESFRGADGMIDAAAMRRAQLAAAAANGLPTYSVQREWEAVEAERQRARAAGEERVDPLLGTVPVPETAQERRARERDEERARKEAEGEDDVSMTGGGEDIKPPAVAQTRERRQRSQVVAQNAQKPARQRPRRADPPRAIDREPRLEGGPG